jgi:hypothetical protein
MCTAKKCDGHLEGDQVGSDVRGTASSYITKHSRISSYKRLFIHFFLNFVEYEVFYFFISVELMAV